MSEDNRFAGDANPQGSGFAPERVSEPPHAAPGSAEDGAAEASGPAAFQRLFDQAQELRDSIVLLLAAKIDRLKLSARRALLAAVVGILGLLVAATYLITATVLAIIGISEGLGDLFRDRLWLGHLATGLGLLAILALTLYLGMRRVTRASHERTVQKYATRRDQQAARSGRPSDG
jgi:hypothetical protein